MSRTRLKVTICGTDYFLFADDSEEYVLTVAREVERRMEELMRSSTRISLTTAAVMTALSCCDEELKATTAADELRAQTKEYVADSVRRRTEAEETRQEMDRLRAQIRELNDELADMAEKNAADARAHMEELEQAHQQIRELREAAPAKHAPTASRPPVHEEELAEQTRLELPDSPARPSELSSGEFMSLFDTFASGRGSEDSH